MSPVDKLIALVRKLCAPVYLVSDTDHCQLEAEELQKAVAGEVVWCHKPETIVPLKAPPIHLHFNVRKPKRTASMGPSMRPLRWVR